MKKLILITVFACFVASCNVTESIVFNKDMGGEYVSSFDLSPMMNYANENRPSSKEGPKKEKIDTTIVFNDFYKTHKDSIAALSEEERARLDKLKGMVMHMNMDEEKGIFKFDMVKPFKTITELETINDQLDEAMGIAKGIGNKDGAAPSGQLDELTKTDKVTYTLKGNMFSRFQPDSIEPLDGVDEDLEVEEQDGFADQFEAQFEEIFSTSYYTIIYKFPRKVKSVSVDEAVISDDGKTITYEVPWNLLQKDNTLLNFNVVLED